MTNYKITNSEEIRKTGRVRSIGRKVKKVPLQAKTLNTVQLIQKNTKTSNKKKSDKNKRTNTKI
jgi:hypothetical protein